MKSDIPTNPGTLSPFIARLLEEARAQLGQERDNVVFVRDCCVAAWPGFRRHASTHVAMLWARLAMAGWTRRAPCQVPPRLGDLIFFRAPQNGGKIHHVGIVLDVGARTLRTIEVVRLRQDSPAQVAEQVHDPGSPLIYGYATVLPQ